MRRCFLSAAFGIATVAVFLSAGPVSAQVAQTQGARVAPGPQQSASPEKDDFVNRLNGNTVSIVSGNPNGTYLSIAYDIAAVLDNGDDLRVLPIIGKAGGQNVKDILYLRGVDMGVTQSNIMRHLNETGEVGKNIENRLRYIARLYNEEMHVLARSEYNTLQDLRGKTVNFSDRGSGGDITGRLLFRDLKLEVKAVNMGQNDAFEALKKGQIDATLQFAGKPSGAFAKLAADPAYKFISVPYTPELFEAYLPTKLTNEDYPNMIPKDQPVDTVAVSAVLAVFNWAPNTERYRRVAKFTEAFYANFNKFLEKPRHPKWKEVNLAAELPGWTRFAPAQEILAREKRTPENDTQLKEAFEQFLARLSPADTRNVNNRARRDELFAKFLEWHKSTQQSAR